MAAASSDAFRYAHAHRAEIAWMSQNTNHLVPPGIVARAIDRALEERVYEEYPYAPGDPELRALVLKDLGFPQDAGFFLAAGGTEALYALTRALLAPGDDVLGSDPSYLIIHRFVELSGATTRMPDIYAPPFRLTPEIVEANLTPQTRMILLIDPLNPLGSGYPREAVRAIAEIARDRKLLLLHDVTYRDFADAPTSAAEFHPEGTLTVWSVSKNCGLAGLRLGGLVARPELVRQVARYNTNDLGVNVLAQRAAIALLETKAQWIDGVRAQTRANQDRIREAARGWPGVELPVYPSQANMFVLDVSRTGIAPEALQNELLYRHGVFLRSGAYLSPAHGGRFVRASFSNVPADIDRLLTAFPLALEALRPKLPAS
ncbi:MAG: pyridoxal phosphate-dependent aminotransferase [Thermoplasmata archaeon]|nr:pyridoxal phosphate-dependent aminotransferase [Thermoplasmata archaeon]